MYISNHELREIKELLYRRIGQASHGLMYSTGQIIGRNIASQLGEDNFFQEAGDRLRERGIVRDIIFKESKVEVRGSVEIDSKTNDKTCHILEGILVALYQSHGGERRYCNETECESKGNDKCIFQIKDEII
ncbi:MAG: 4-vinyl reductase [Candidatus Altiarchaeota archaeon]|nr:4-vinyl reductase [Candidatus Altiarchaeota archaeon]